MFLIIVATANASEKMNIHFEEGCGMWGTPTSLGMAIAKVESDFRPWAVNIQGKSYYMNDRESALALIKKASAQRKSYDLGLMQINSYWLKKLKLNPADVLDPKINVIIGCWILSEELKRYGMTWKAIGAYHTPVAKNPDRARAYANKVLRTWEDYK
ncbi:lytic transglycosylase domain-containing protein [Desulfovibrio sp. OttesenSCG-928-C14]|nr:lytic transglycosylase domain-containing protein [Desulfovibrio sp. OttesenSCG-928-C14]